MFVSKKSGQLVGIIEIDPLGDVEDYVYTMRRIKNREYHFVQSWEQMLAVCHCYCPD